MSPTCAVLYIFTDFSPSKLVLFCSYLLIIKQLRYFYKKITDFFNRKD